MTSAARYLLEVSAGICVVYVVYALLFKRSTFFQLNRFYLMIGLLVSFFAPLINLPSNLTQDIPLTMLNAEKIETDYAPILFQRNAGEESVVSIAFMLQLAYALGVSFFLVRFVIGIWNVMALKRRSLKVDVNGIVYIQESLPTFSFFNIIFARPDTNRIVIDHERIHIRQMHWLDVLLVEFASIILWFNPILIWYKKAIKMQHEYLADQGVVAGQPDAETYMSCLVKTAYATNGIPVTSQFASHSIKNRIIMLTKNKTPRLHALLYFAIVPATAFLLFAFQDSSIIQEKPSQPQYQLPNQSAPDASPIEKEKLKMTYGFGEKFNPVTNKMQNHTGMDFLSDAGVNVMATADGVVVDTKFDEIKGNYVVIKHNDRFTTQYFHMSRVTVKTGTTIRKGEVIGFVGSTGLSIRDHLHYEVLKDGKAVDPIEYLPKEFSDGC